MGFDEYRRPDLTPFVGAIRQFVDDDVVVCSNQTTNQSDECATLLATTSFEPNIPMFFFYEEDTSEFLGSLGLVHPILRRTNHTMCEPKPRIALTNDACRRDVSASLDIFTGGFIDGATRYKVEHKEIVFEEVEQSTQCVGTNSVWVEHDTGPHAGERLFLHSRRSTRAYDTHTDEMILFTVTRYLDDSGDERAFLEDVADAFHDTMLRIDLSTRGTSTYQIEEQLPPSEPTRETVPSRTR